MSSESEILPEGKLETIYWSSNFSPRRAASRDKVEVEGPLAKLSLRLPAVEGRGRFGILKGDRLGDGGVRVITENGRVFAAITGTTVTKQRQTPWVAVRATICWIIVRFEALQGRRGGSWFYEPQKLERASLFHGRKRQEIPSFRSFSSDYFSLYYHPFVISHSNLSDP